MHLLRKLMKRRKGILILTVTFGIICSVMNLWWNMILIQILDILENGESVSNYLWQTALIIVLADALVNVLFELCSGWTCECFGIDLRSGYIQYLSNEEEEVLKDLNVGSAMSIVQNEMSEVNTFFSQQFFMLIGNLISFLLTLGFMVYQSPTLTLAMNLPVIGILLYVIWSSKVIGGWTNLCQEKKRQMNQMVEIVSDLLPVLQIYDAISFLLGKYEGSVREWKAAASKEERLKAKLMSLSAMMTCFPPLVLFLVGGIMVIRKATTFGIVFAFFNLSKNVSGALINMPLWIGLFRHFLTNLNRIPTSYVNANERCMEVQKNGN